MDKRLVLAAIIVIIALILFTSLPSTQTSFSQTINYTDFSIEKSVSTSTLTNARTENYSFNLKNPIVAFIIIPKSISMSATNVKVAGDFNISVLSDDPIFLIQSREYSPGKKSIRIESAAGNYSITSIALAMPLTQYSSFTEAEKTQLSEKIKEFQSLDENYFTKEESLKMMQEFADSINSAGLKSESGKKVSFASAETASNYKWCFDIVMNAMQGVIDRRPSLSSGLFVAAYIATITFTPEPKSFQEDINLYVSDRARTDSEILYLTNETLPEVSVQDNLSGSLVTNTEDLGTGEYAIHVDLNLQQNVFDTMDYFTEITANIEVRLSLADRRVVTAHIRKDPCLKEANDASKTADLNNEQKAQIETTCYESFFRKKNENLKTALAGMQMAVTTTLITEYGIDNNDPSYGTEKYYEMKVMNLKISGEAAQLEAIRKMKNSVVNTLDCNTYLPNGYLEPSAGIDYSNPSSILISPESRTAVPTKIVTAGGTVVNKSDMDAFDAMDKDSLNAYLNTGIKSIIEDSNYFLNSDLSYKIGEYKYRQCQFEKELSSAANYFSIIRPRLATLADNSALTDIVNQVIENKLLISDNEIAYQSFKNGLDFISSQLYSSAMDKILSDNWETLCPYVANKYDCEEKLFDQYMSSSGLTYSGLYSDASSTDLDATGTTSSALLNFKQGHAYSELTLRIYKSFADANTSLFSGTTLVDAENKSILAEHDSLSQIFSCQSSMCTFYKELLSKRKNFKAASIELSDYESWPNRLSYAKAMYDYLFYQSKYPGFATSKASELSALAKRAKDQFIESSLLKDLSSEIDGDTQLLILFHSNLAEQAQKLADDKTGDNLTSGWQKFDFYTRTYLNVYNWITLGSAYRNEDFDELTFSSDLASLISARKILIKGFDTYLQSNIKSKDFGLIKDYYTQSTSGSSLYDKSKAANLAFKKYATLEDSLKSFGEFDKDYSQEIKDFAMKVQTEGYSAAKRYSDNDMKAIARVKLAGLMTEINGTAVEFRSTKTYDDSRALLKELGVNFGPIYPDDAGTEYIYTMLPPVKWAMNLTYGTYQDIKNKSGIVSDSDMDAIMNEQVSELANNPLKDYTTFKENASDFFVTIGDLKWWAVFVLVEEAIPITAGLNAAGRGLLRTTQLATLNVLGKSTYKMMAKAISRSLASTGGYLRGRMAYLATRALGETTYNSMQREGAIYYWERTLAEKVVQNYPGSSGVMRALTSAKPGAASKYLAKLAWTRASKKAFLDLPLESEVFRYSLLSKTMIAPLGGDYAKLAYEVASDDKLLIPIDTGSFNGEAAIIDTGSSKVLVLKRKTGWTTLEPGTELEIDVESRAFDAVRDVYPNKAVAFDIGPTALDNKSLAKIVDALQPKNVTSELSFSNSVEEALIDSAKAGEVLLLSEGRAIALVSEAQPIVDIAEAIGIMITDPATISATTKTATVAIAKEQIEVKFTAGTLETGSCKEGCVLEAALPERGAISKIGSSDGLAKTTSNGAEADFTRVESIEFISSADIAKERAISASGYGEARIPADLVLSAGNDASGYGNAEGLADLLGVQNTTTLAYQAGTKNTGIVLHNAGPADLYYFIKGIRQKNMTRKIIDASKIIKADPYSAGDFIYLYRPEAASILVGEYGAENVAANLGKLVDLKRSGGKFSDAKTLLSGGKVRVDCGKLKVAAKKEANEKATVAHFMTVLGGCVFESGMPFMTGKKDTAISGDLSGMSKVMDPISLPRNYLSLLRTDPLKVVNLNGLMVKDAGGSLVQVDVAAVMPKIKSNLQAMFDNDAFYLIRNIDGEATLEVYHSPIDTSVYKAKLETEFLAMYKRGRYNSPELTIQYVDPATGSNHMPESREMVATLLADQPALKQDIVDALVSDLKITDSTTLGKIVFSLSDGSSVPMSEIIPEFVSTVQSSSPVLFTTPMDAGQGNAIQVQLADELLSHVTAPTFEEASAAIRRTQLKDQSLTYAWDKGVSIDKINIETADGALNPLSLALPEYVPVKGFEDLGLDTFIQVTAGSPTGNMLGYGETVKYASKFGGTEGFDQAIKDAASKPTFSTSYGGYEGKKEFYFRKVPGAQEMDFMVVNIEDGILPIRNLDGTYRKSMMGDRKYYDKILRFDGDEFMAVVRENTSSGMFKAYKSANPNEMFVQTSYDYHLKLEMVTEGGTQKLRTTAVGERIDASKYSAAGSSELGDFGKGLETEYDLSGYGR